MNLKQLITLQNLTYTLLLGIEGNRFSWGQGQRRAWVPILAKIGIILVTKTQINKRGYRLKRNQKPVGTVYFGAPIQCNAEVFILEIQCVKNPPDES